MMDLGLKETSQTKRTPGKWEAFPRTWSAVGDRVLTLGELDMGDVGEEAPQSLPEKQAILWTDP